MTYYLLVLAILQSILEFLPVSSSAHIAIFLKFIKVEETLSLKISLHIGTALSVLIYYIKPILRDIPIFFKSPKESIGLRVIATTIPAIIVGLFLNKKMIYSIVFLGYASILGGLLLFMADSSIITLAKMEKFILKFLPLKYFKKNKNIPSTEEYIKISHAFYIGLFQVMSFFGMSRMGMCITGSRMCSINRRKATDYTFIVMLPVVLGAVILNLPNIKFDFQMLFLILISMLIGLVTIHLVLKIIEHITYKPFAIYRIFLGLFIILFHHYF